MAVARKVAEDRVISVNDPGARHARKSPEGRRDGYRVHVAADPGTGIITGEKLTRAAGTENSDPAVAEEFLAAGTAAGDEGPGGPAGGAGDAGGREDGPPAGGERTWYSDSAYGTGDLRDAIGKAGHQAVIKPKPLQNGTVTCPAGVTRTIPPGRAVVFGAACRSCPLRVRCTTSKSGRRSASTASSPR